ncbi:exodeoxyribonuclease III [bacterium]|nr:exodeoxyribonuclease III [bacterium]
MKLISWNINGIRAAWGKGLNNFVVKEKPQIVCLQELKIQAHQITTALRFKNYTVGESFAAKKGYSGVGTYTNGVESKSAVPRKLGHKVTDGEGRLVETDLGAYLLWNVYIPSGTSGDERQGLKYEFLEQFTKAVKKLKPNDRKRLVICGDFNICHREIDIHHPETATRQKLTGFLPEEREWFSSFLDLGLIDTYREVHGDRPKSYTWWSYRANARPKNLGWRIDYFLVAEGLRKKIIDAKIYDKIKGSDHCPIGLTIKT